MARADSVAKNTTYYTIALVFQKVLAFIYFSLIARYMGVEDTGKYTFALSFTTMFAIFIDLGLAPVLTREIAKAKNAAQRYLSNIMALKIPLAVTTYLLVAGMINILGYPEVTRQLVYLSGIVMFMDSFSLTFWHVMRGNQKLKYESVGVMVMQFVTVGLGSLVLYMHLGLKYLMLALIAGSFLNLILAIATIVGRLKISIVPHYEPQVLKLLFKIGVPFALAGIFNRLYTTFDTVLLSALAGDKAVGWYSIPIKITTALQFLPMAFMAAVFPAMSEYFVSDKAKLKQVFEKAMQYLMLISLPMAAGVFVLAEPIILQVYTPEYANSILPLKILMISLFFLFINFPVGYLLNACNRQVTNTVNVGVALVVSVVLNIILIPRYEYVGTAISVLVSTIVLFTLGMLWVPKIVEYSRWYLIKNFLRILVASILMAGVIYYLLAYLSTWYLIPIAAAVYFMVLFILGGLRIKDIKDVFNSIKGE